MQVVWLLVIYDFFYLNTRELIFDKNYYCYAQCHVFCHALSQQCSPKLNVTDCDYSQEWKSQILYLLSMDCTTTGQWANQIQVSIMSGVYIVYTPVVAWIIK